MYSCKKPSINRQMETGKIKIVHNYSGTDNDD